jgi:hypothetical protein
MEEVFTVDFVEAWHVEFNQQLSASTGISGRYLSYIWNHDFVGGDGAFLGQRWLGILQRRLQEITI